MDAKSIPDYQADSIHLEIHERIAMRTRTRHDGLSLRQVVLWYRMERSSSPAGVSPTEVQRLSRRTITPIDSLVLGYEILLKHAKSAAFSPPSQRRWSFLCRERRVYVLRRTRNARSKAHVPRLAWTLLLYSTASKPSRNQRSY